VWHGGVFFFFFFFSFSSDVARSQHARAGALRSKASRSLFRSFLRLTCDALYSSCRDITEFRHMIRMLYPHYLAPIVAGTAKPGDTGALYRNVKPHFEAALRSLYLREGAPAMPLDEDGDSAGPAAAAKRPRLLRVPGSAAPLIGAPPAAQPPGSSSSSAAAPDAAEAAGAARPVKAAKLSATGGFVQFSVFGLNFFFF
jgi:hypothetical protein